MYETTQEELHFFGERPESLPMYLAFVGRLFDELPDSGMRVQKTQITFTNPRVFACVSFLRALRKAEMPDPFLTITLGLSHQLSSPRVSAQSEPYPGRWTTHFVIGSPDELDDELFGWMHEAYDFAASKRRER